MLTAHVVTVNKCVKTGKCDKTGKCGDVASVILRGVASGYTVDTTALASNGLTASCTDTGQGSKTQTSTGIGAGN